MLYKPLIEILLNTTVKMSVADWTENAANSRPDNFFATMKNEPNMQESTAKVVAHLSCFFLVKTNIFLDSSVGRAPDC